jgi:hypothetical protein
MRSIRRSGRIVTILTCAGLAACADNSTGPGAEPVLDTETALADYDALEAVLASGALDGFRALEGRIPFDAAALVGPLAAPIISESHRGATFVYDPTADRYTVDEEREGAPATGVRFVLYDVDAGGAPIVHAERGYADLVDEGDASVEDVALRLTVVDGDETVLEHATTVDADEGKGALTVRGFLQDEARLDFEIRAVGTDAGDGRTLDIDLDLRIDERDFAVEGTVAGREDGAENEGTIDVSVLHGHRSLHVDVAADAGEIDGSIYLNGDAFATVSGPADDPAFAGPGGRALRPVERLVLWRVFAMVEDVFDFLEDLVDPVDELLALGFVL